MNAHTPTTVPLPTPRAWQLLGELIELPREQRDAAAHARCGGDQALLAEVVALLAADTAPSVLLDHCIDPAQIMTAGDVDALVAPWDGTDVGPYTLLAELGRGGMGVVYRAERRGGMPGNHVALKVIKRGMDSEEIVARFMREREILAQLRHPNIALLIDGGMAGDGQAWFAMELVDGLPITTWCDRERLTIDARVHLFIDVCAAVSHAHRNLVVHRDIKPSNVLVDTEGHVKLLDFGVAKLLDDSNASRTSSQLRMLTPEFAAPEQFADGPITTATDVYQLGLVLHDLVLGRRLPRPLDTPRPELDDATIAGLRSMSVAAWKRATSGDLLRIVHKAANQDVARRYASVSELADDLQRYLDGLPVRAQPDRVGYRIGKFLKRHPASSTLTIVLLLALLAATGVSVYQANIARTQLARADAVRQFLAGIFRNADPDATKGEPFTALTLLAQSEHELDDTHQRSPAVQADLTGVLGEAYMNLGDYARADVLVHRANALASEHGVPRDVTARNLRLLAQLERGQSRFDDAIAHARAALPIAPDTLEGGDRESTEARRVLIDALVAKGDIDEAETELKRVLDDDKVVHGAASQQVVSDYMMFARVYDRTDRDAQAEAAYRQAIDAALASPDRSTSDLAYSYNALGILLRNKKADYAGADAALAEAERIYARNYGEDSRNAWAVRSNRIAGLEMRGDIVEALAGREKMLAHFRQTADAEPANLAWSFYFVARDEGTLGHLDAANGHAQESVDAWRKLQGADSFEAVYPLQLLAQIAELHGHFEDARARYDEVLSVAARNKSSDAKRLVEETRGSIGNLARVQGRVDEALAALGPAETALESFGNPSDVGLLGTQAKLIEAQVDGGYIVQAGTGAEQLLSRANKTLPPASTRMSSVLYAVGRAELAAHRADDALAHLREARAIREKLMPADDIRVLEIDVELARALAQAQAGQGDASRRLASTIAPLLAARQDAYALALSRRLGLAH
jgi:serine/threonine-protein kinase